MSTMFSCQKALPLVYDDALSYYEVLCKLQREIEVMKKYIEDNFTEIIEDNLEDIFNRVMVDFVYDAETETITLKKEIVADGMHRFNTQTNTIEVM